MDTDVSKENMYDIKFINIPSILMFAFNPVASFGRNLVKECLNIYIFKTFWILKEKKMFSFPISFMNIRRV